MRHGEAEALQHSDQQRQLTARGVSEVTQVSSWLQKHYPAFDRVLCSPYQRTQQTAGLMLQKQPAGTQLDIVPELVPDGDASQVQCYLDALWSSEPNSRFLLVSHMPLVSFLVETFTLHRSAPVFSTAGMAFIDYQPGQGGRLLEKVSPQELKLMSV
jgi:phosphohistidine phosphatase